MSSAEPQLDRNPFSPANILDPVPFHRDLRTHAPVYFSDVVHGWLVTRYDDVSECGKDPRLSADRTDFFVYRFQDAGPEIVQDYIAMCRQQMVMLDGPAHQRLRRLSGPTFSPQVLDALLPAIRRAMHLLVDAVAPQGRMDLVPAISHQLPPLVIAECFGIPPEDRERFRAWGRPLAEFSSSGVPPEELSHVGRRANQAVREMNAYLGALVEQRRRAPGGDMLSQLIAVQEAGRMTPEEVVAQAILIVTAGHLTTTDQLSNLVHDLLCHPEQLALLRAERRWLRSAVEEGLRYTPAINFMSRVAAETFPLRGHTVQRGQPVFLGLSAANRDPAVFPDPDRFDITRDFLQHKHLSFAPGPHHCLGAGLARRELEIALDVLLERLPGLRLDASRPPTRHIEGILTRGFSSLPLLW